MYKGRKFNARKETAIGETYLGIQIYRFYIRCPKCLSEITFKVRLLWREGSGEVVGGHMCRVVALSFNINPFPLRHG